MTRVLSVASECVPLEKTGGLADVVGALPAALVPQGVEMRTLLPGYPSVMAKLSETTDVLRLDGCFGGRARIVHGTAAGLDLYVLDAPHLFDRAGNIYLGADGKDWEDNPQRFAALSQAAAAIATQKLDGWNPEVVHAHDWQAGLVPVYLKASGAPHVPTVLTIHNIAFQGLVSANMLNELDLPSAGFTRDGFEYYGKISMLKAGMMACDRLTTVSPTYARELMTPEFGMGLEGVAHVRAAEFSGILNGIDTEIWDPRTDPDVSAPYDTPEAKQANTEALRRELGLPQSDGPLAVVVSRLTTQKGIDVLVEALPTLLAGGGQLAVLGSGDAMLEGLLGKAAQEHAGVALHVGYNEAMSHRMIAGGDTILVPSRFEPCGLTQLYGLRYGTLPLVARTGGLADTVIDANPAGLRAGVATGFQVAPLTADTLAAAFRHMLDCFRDRSLWTAMQRNAMAQSVGWEVSAGEYAALYRGLTAAR